jgi:hypothetical protein
MFALRYIKIARRLSNGTDAQQLQAFYALKRATWIAPNHNAVKDGVGEILTKNMVKQYLLRGINGQNCLPEVDAFIDSLWVRHGI